MTTNSPAGLRAADDGTLDLTRIKLTVGQLVVFVMLVSGPIAGTAVSLYQLSEVRKAQDMAASAATEIAKRLASLESDRAEREGYARGLKAAEAVKRAR